MLAVIIPVLLVASSLLPVVDARAVAWLLPALALTAVATAMSTWWTPYVSAGVAALAWSSAVMIVPWLDGTATLVARSELFGPSGQLTFAALLIGATAVAAARRDFFRSLEAR